MFHKHPQNRHAGVETLMQWELCTYFRFKYSKHRVEAIQENPLDNIGTLNLDGQADVCCGGMGNGSEWEIGEPRSNSICNPYIH